MADTHLRSSDSQAIRGCGGGGSSPVDEKGFGEITNSSGGVTEEIRRERQSSDTRRQLEDDGGKD